MQAQRDQVLRIVGATVGPRQSVVTSQRILGTSFFLATLFTVRMLSNPAAGDPFPLAAEATRLAAGLLRALWSVFSAGVAAPRETTAGKTWSGEAHRWFLLTKSAPDPSVSQPRLIEPVNFER